MASYSKELKDSITTRLITGETSASDMARETGININTIYRWRDKAKKTGISSTTKFKAVCPLDLNQQINGARRTSFRLF